LIDALGVEIGEDDLRRAAVVLHLVDEILDRKGRD
jgi:hypothetical protein